MGIYISNLKIPKDEYLPINIYPDGGVACRFDANCANAIEIPPHGRLIDADKITEHKYATIPPYRKKYADGKPKSDEEIIAFKFGWNYAIDAIVENAPTIIPASDKDINVLDKKEGET